jgi:mannose-1-phosphate guanylyltransferase
MFFWRAGEILSEMHRQLPDLHRGLMEIKTALSTNKGADVVREVWSNFVNTTIDYGVMEGAQDVYVLPASDLGWVDVGDWGRLYEILASDEAQVVAPASALIQESGSSLVLQAEGIGEDRMIALLDVHDLVVIDTQDALLICKRQSAERVKELIEELKSSGREEYL